MTGSKPARGTMHPMFAQLFLEPGPGASFAEEEAPRRLRRPRRSGSSGIAGTVTGEHGTAADDEQRTLRFTGESPVPPGLHR